VVDDQEVARFLIRQCLPIPAFELTEAATGEEGLLRARSERPDVVVLDLVMPDGDGRDVLRRLRQDAATADIPVVVVTSTVLDGAERARLLSSAAALLSKADLSREVLGDAIRAAARRPAEERS
jgi:two-component system cell cycle response regulator DivK